MTDSRFDEVTKALGKSASRRTVFKGVLAAVFGGLLTRAAGGDAAAFRGRRGCSRLGQDCGGANPGCCSGLVCDGETATCLTPLDGSCIQDSDCVAGTVCRPFGAFSYHCQAAGAVGEQCADDTDCSAPLVCDTATGFCGEQCGAVICSPVETCDAYTVTCETNAVPFDDATAVAGGWQLTSSATGAGTAHLNFPLSGPVALDSITELSTDFTFETDDSCCGGSPRYQLGVVDSTNAPVGNIFVYLGPSPSFTGCASDTLLSSGNLIGNDDPCRWDTSQISTGTQCNTYTGAQALLSSLGYQIATIDLYVDSGWCFGDNEQTVVVDPTVAVG